MVLTISGLGVGGNGSILVADNAQASGLKYDTIAGILGYTPLSAVTNSAALNNGKIWVAMAQTKLKSLQLVVMPR